VHHLNATLSCGSCVALLGPNGAGKTTLLKAIAGLLPLETGRIEFRGHQLESTSGREIAYVPQREAVDWDFPITVRSGHSLSTLVLSPEPLDFAGVSIPDALVILSDDGLAKTRSLLPRMAPEATVLAFPDVAALETPARLIVLDPAAAATRLARADHGLAACAAAIEVLGLFPAAALVEAAAASGRLAEELGKVVAAGLAMGAAAR